MARTSVALESETRERLRSLKRGGESYDELMNCILDRIDRDASGKVILE